MWWFVAYVVAAVSMLLVCEWDARVRRGDGWRAQRRAWVLSWRLLVIDVQRRARLLRWAFALVPMWWASKRSAWGVRVSSDRFGCWDTHVLRWRGRAVTVRVSAQYRLVLTRVEWDGWTRLFLLSR